MIPADLARAAKSSAKTAYMLSEIMAHLVRVPLLGARFDGPARRRIYSEACANAAKRVLGRIGFEIEVVGWNEALMREKNFLMVGNHMSYLDIMVTATATPIIFVTSVDMGQVPLLGRMAELGGSLFVERRHRGQVDRDLRGMSEVLRQGFNVMIYPEGTSSNGLEMLPFKKSLLMAAVEAERDIMPVCLKYVSIDDEPFSAANCDKVAWYGEMNFLPHFLGVMNCRKIKARVEFLSPIKVTRESTRNELAEKSYAAIYAAYFGRPAPPMPVPTRRPEGENHGQAVVQGN